MEQLNKPIDSSGGLASTVGGSKLPDANNQALNKLPDGGIINQTQPNNPSKYVNNGLASMFGVMGQNPQGIGLPAQQPMFSGYKNMWQPNMGANYQIIGGVGNII